MTLAGDSPQPEVPVLEPCMQEIVDLHRFFEGWLAGEIEATDAAFARCVQVLAPGFEMVRPDGRTIDRSTLVAELRRAHGVRRDATPAFRIWIEGARGRALGDGLGLVHYEEWQSAPGAARGRQSTAIMRLRDDTPNGVEWLFVQETWLAGENIQAAGSGS